MRMNRLAVATTTLTAVTALGLGLMAASGPESAVVEGSHLASSNAADTYVIDGSHSAIVFRIKHLGVSYAYGRFNDISGEVVWDDANPEASTLNIQVKTESVDTASEKRDQHLRSPDFFSAKEFPVSSFTSTSVEKISNTTYKVTGDFQLHGVTKQVTADLEYIGDGKDPWGGHRAGFETTITIKRSDFDMTTYIDNGGLGDDVRLIIAIEGIKQQADG